MLPLPFLATDTLERSRKYIREMIKVPGSRARTADLQLIGLFTKAYEREFRYTNCGLLTEVKRESCGAFLTADTRMRDLLKALANIKLMRAPGNNTNRIQLTVCLHLSGYVLLVGILENSGQSANGAAVQSMNLMLGFGEKE